MSRRLLFLLVLGLLALPASAQAAPRQVLLVGGTFAYADYMDGVKAYLEDRGFAVSTMQLSGVLPGAAAIPTSARAIGARVDEIRAASGAATVDLAGHSQGALAVRDYIKHRGGMGKVDVAISVGGPQYGDATAYACLIFAGCWDMTYGSAFLTALNDGDDTPGDLGWFHLYSTSAVYEKHPLEGAVNVAVQDLCPGRSVQHVDEWRDGAMREMVLAALERRQVTSTCPA